MDRRGCLRILVRVVWIGLLLVVLLFAGVALYNQTLPTSSPEVSELSREELARLSEVTHLRRSLGNRVWPGWGEMEIPLLVYNEEFAFLVGIDQPGRGWMRVPYSDSVEGGTWEQAPGGDYFRQVLPASGATPQAFIVKNGDRFAASMTTKAWTRIRMVQMIKGELPGFLSPFVPYGVFLMPFNSDWHISAILHESFHVLQARQAYQRLVEAERSTAMESSYPWENTDLREWWVKERELLAEAMEAGDSDRLRELAGEWLKLREARREQVSPALVDYERQREWLEGLAKYAEIQIWREAGRSETYSPVTAMDRVPDFDRYREAVSHRQQEISQLKSDLQFDDTIFYYSGWAQAELLDRLDADWKAAAFEQGVFLDEMIRERL